MRPLIVEVQDQVDALAVQDRRNVSGDHILFSLFHGSQIVIGHSLAVDRQARAVEAVHKRIAFDLIVRIASQVDETASVIQEDIPDQGLHHTPLILGQYDPSVLPDQCIRIKVILQDVFRRAFSIHGPAHEQVQDTAGIPAAAAGSEHTAQQFVQSPGGIACRVASSASQQAVHQAGISRCMAAVTGNRRSRTDLAADLKACKFLDATGVFLIHPDVLEGGHRLLDLVGPFIGKIDTQPVRVADPAPGTVVLDCAFQGLGQILAFVRTQVPGKVDQVDLVDPALLGELPAFASGCGHLLVLLVLDQVVRLDAEFFQFLRDSRLELRKIRHAQRGCLAAAFLVTDFNKVVDDRLPQVDRRRAGVLPKLVQPVRVVPAYTGFCFFACDHIVGILAQHDTVLDRRHQAGIKSDKSNPIKSNLISAAFRALLIPESVSVWP